MSYILEALKKSDQERLRRTTPGIRSIYTASGQPAPRRGKPWPYLLIFLLLGCSSFLLWRLYLLQSPKLAQEAQKQNVEPEIPTSVKSTSAEKKTVDPGVQPAPVTAKSETVRPDTGIRTEAAPPITPDNHIASQTSPVAIPSMQTAPAVTPRNSADTSLIAGATTPDAQKSRIEGGSPSISAESKKPVDPAASEERRAALMELPVVETPKGPPTNPAPPAGFPAQKGPGTAQEFQRNPVRDRRPAPREGTALAQSDLEEAFGKLALPTDQSKPVEQTVPASLQTKSPEPTVAVEQKEPPQLHELPLNVRNQIPDLSFSMFVYSKDPSSRLVGYGGHAVREGQELAPGLKIEQIAPNGAILNFRGQRFMKKVF
jgi:general secretion pathway protein B